MTPLTHMTTFSRSSNFFEFSGEFLIFFLFIFFFFGETAQPNKGFIFCKLNILCTFSYSLTICMLGNFARLFVVCGFF